MLRCVCQSRFPALVSLSAPMPFLRPISGLLLPILATFKPSNLQTNPSRSPSGESCPRKPFVCHSYENNRGASKQFPLWNSLSVTLQNRRSFFSGTYKLPPFSLREAASLFSCAYKLPIFYPLCFDIHASDGGVWGARLLPPTHKSSACPDLVGVTSSSLFPHQIR